MKRVSRISQDDEIDLGEIIKTLWNEKILIFFISLFFMIGGYVLGALQPKIYKSEITIRDATFFLFEDYRGLFGLQQKDFANQFNAEFKLNLSSLDNLVQFFEKTNSVNDTKNYLKEKNISARIYFKEKFKPVKNIDNKYSFTYSQHMRGEVFLNDYIIFEKQQTIEMFKKKMDKIILNNINLYEENLEIAKRVNLVYPNLRSVIDNRGDLKLDEVQLNSLFNNGTEVLSQNILSLKNLLNETKNFGDDYNPILQKATSPVLISISPIIYALTGLLAGLFLSIIIVYFKIIF